MFNKVILVGNLTRDCELKYLPSGTAVCSTGIATSRKWKDQMGEQKEEVCFIDLNFFGRTGEIANQYLSRGKRVLIEGRLKLDQWTDQNGGKRSKHSVNVDILQMLSPKESTPQQGYQQQNYQQQDRSTQTDNGEMPNVDIDTDEIPF